MMTLRTVGRSTLGLLAAAFLAVTSMTAFAESPESESAQDVPEQGTVQQEIGKQLAERRQAMMEEAHAALDETNVALQALDQGKTQDALEALARATGKLELVVARDPELGLAPVDVDFVTYDLYATPESIRIARDQAEALLADGRVQEARALLSGLASEIVISVTNLPLATYPDAIKAISPLIDAGKTAEAKAALTTALSTLAVTKHVVSLPVLRARAALDEAEGLASADAPSAEDKQRADALVEVAREQIQIAELLGYGDEMEHREYRREIADLEGKIRGDEETDGVFAKLRKSLDEFETSFFQ